jgi:hypothetical protein
MTWKTHPLTALPYPWSLVKAAVAFLICLLVLGHVGCRGESPTSPAVPTPSSLELSLLVSLLNDPLVRLLPTTLQNQPAADPIQREMLATVEYARRGDLSAIRSSFASTRHALKTYQARGGVGQGDPVPLAALELVLIRAESLLDELVTPRPSVATAEGSSS